MQVPKRDKIKFVFEVENCGFASLFQEAQLFLIQENEKERKEMLLSEEVQKWHGGSTYKVDTETGAMKGNIFLQIRRKKDGKIISFANKNSADCTVYKARKSSVGTVRTESCFIMGSQVFRQKRWHSLRNRRLQNE